MAKGFSVRSAAFAIAVVIVCGWCGMSAAQGRSEGAAAPSAESWMPPVPTSPGPLPPGTVINMQNWQQYRQYLPDGMQAFFQGGYYWKFPSDFQIKIGLTHHYSFPKEFTNDTEKYSSQVKIVPLPNGGRTMEGYVAGLPFPNASEPLKGWKLLVNMWYTYEPHLLCGYDSFYLVDRFGHIYAEKALQIYRRLGHISDYGQPVNDPQADGIYYSEYIRIVAPEQSRYLTNLTLYYMDNTKPIDTFLFIPALRRSLRLSSAARCSPLIGTDFTQDDSNRGNFNGDWTLFDSTVIREAEIPQLTVANIKNVGNLDNYYKPVFFPKPIVGDWEIRPTWVLDVRRIPSQATGYCYSKKIYYLDKETYLATWNDGYDATGKLWKVFESCNFARPIPHEGWSGNSDQWLNPAWDVQSSHLTLGMATTPQGDVFRFNEDCRNFEGENFDDLGRYSKASGLNEIMQ